MNRFLPICALLCIIFTSSLHAERAVYKIVDDKELSVILMKPDEWKASDKRPAIVWFHGGGWVGGPVNQFEDHAHHFAKLGIVSALVKYRFIGKGDKRPTLPCRDAKSAMRWMRENATELGIDPNRIAAGGGSAGGHLAAFTALVDGTNDPADNLQTSPKPQALLLFNPVLDNGPDGGWSYDRVGGEFKKFSPAHNVGAEAPPTVMFLGTKDDLIPVSTLQSFKKNMKQAGARCELHLYEGLKHGFFNKEPAKADTIGKTEAFLRELNWIKS